MPVNLTLKNVPDDVYERLKASAKRHRRSLDCEAIACLEAALLPKRMSAAEILEKARALRATLSAASFDAGQIDAYKRDGRR